MVMDDGSSRLEIPSVGLDRITEAKLEHEDW